MLRRVALFPMIFVLAMMLRIDPAPDNLTAAERLCIASDGWRADLRGPALRRFCLKAGSFAALQFEPRYFE